MAGGLALLVGLLEAARANEAVFGRFLGCGLVGRGGVVAAWSRDVLPLPWATDSTLQLSFGASQHCRGFCYVL